MNAGAPETSAHCGTGESRGSQKVPTEGRGLISTTEDRGADSDGLGHIEPAGIF